MTLAWLWGSILILVGLWDGYVMWWREPKWSERTATVILNGAVIGYVLYTLWLLAK